MSKPWWRKIIVNEYFCMSIEETPGLGLDTTTYTPRMANRFMPLQTATRLPSFLQSDPNRNTAHTLTVICDEDCM